MMGTRAETQGALASAAGIDARRLSQLARARAPARLAELVSAAAALGVCIVISGGGVAVWPGPPPGEEGAP